MASFWSRLFGRIEPEQNLLLENIIEKSEEAPADTAIDTLKKEAMSYEINPYDISNSEMLSSAYDSSGKQYYFETLDGFKVSYDTLSMLSKHPIVAAIVQTRINQSAEFAQFSNDDDIGFRIKLRDDMGEPSEGDIAKMQEIKQFIQDCGSETLDFELTFEGFIRQIVRDSLVYDQCCFEVVRNRSGKVIGFLPVDASTIRRSKMSKEEKSRGRRDPTKPAYVQVVQNKVVAEFGQKDLCFGIRRPRTNMGVKKYGYPELEELVKVLTDLQSAEIFNASNFNNGISANGIIAIKSKMDPKLFRVFRREFYQMLTGVNNAKRTPLIQLDPEGDEDIRSINLTSSNKDMEYNAWVSYLIKVLCSVYQMDPAEIGFVFGSEGQSSALIQADPTARVLMGKEKGLRPLIRSIQSWINKYVIYQIDPRFELEFIGLDSISPKDKIKIEEHRMKYMTINEIRNMHDLEPVESGDIIADAYVKIATTQIKSDLPVGEYSGGDVEKSLDDDLNYDDLVDDNGVLLKKKERTKLTSEEKAKREKEMDRRKKDDKPNYKPLPGDDKVKTKPSKYSKTKLADAVREEMKKPGKDEFLRAASKVSGVKRSIIEEVYDRGLAAWSGSHRPGATAPQWAKARVYSFLTGGKTQRTADKDLWEKHKESKKSVELDEDLSKGETYIPPKSVADEAQRAIDAKEKHGDKVKGGTQVGWTRARQLANREGISEETIRRMKAFFDRHEKNKDVKPEDKDFPWGDNGYTSWSIWGGDPGRSWSEMMVERFNKEDEK
jgi:hypothetical protein